MELSEYFNLNKTQSELDFVNTPVNSDILLFIDPFAISIRSNYDSWTSECNDSVVHYFQRIVDLIRKGKTTEVLNLLSHLGEPNEIGFGYSKKSQGSGIGNYLAGEMFNALKNSTAVKTGFIQSIEECELMVEGISRDKISDMTTNIIRRHLIEYTKNQCDLLGIELNNIPLAPYYSVQHNDWINEYHDLPIVNGRPKLFVPKYIARCDVAYNHYDYYNNPVLNFLKAEHLSANTSLVKLLKNKKSVVYKKDIRPTFACTKENLYEFSKKHPNVLKEYRKELEELEKKNKYSYVDLKDEKMIASALFRALKSIKTGTKYADEYHSLMVGIIEFLFYPNLINPKKEAPIHSGRKRIDIRTDNAANSGILFRLHMVHKIPCQFVVIECKNYSNDVANAELDQLAGRFSIHRGRLGFILSRSFENKKIFVKRCIDTYKDDRGIIIPFDDNIILEMLNRIIQGKRGEIEVILDNLIKEICFS
jgi:hypothetical protein